MTLFLPSSLSFQAIILLSSSIPIQIIFCNCFVLPPNEAMNTTFVLFCFDFDMMFIIVYWLHDLPNEALMYFVSPRQSLFMVNFLRDYQGSQMWHMTLGTLKHYQMKFQFSELLLMQVTVTLSWPFIIHVLRLNGLSNLIIVGLLSFSAGVVSIVSISNFPFLEAQIYHWWLQFQKNKFCSHMQVMFW